MNMFNVANFAYMVVVKIVTKDGEGNGGVNEFDLLLCRSVISFIHAISLIKC